MGSCVFSTRIHSSGYWRTRFFVLITGTKFRNITGDPELTDAQVLIITELLDEMSPKGVFKEFNSEIRKSLKAAK